ncbi:MAG: OsmC family protein [Bacteroidota bacterium]
MVKKIHQYNITNEWTGNLGEGTKTYKTYSRDHVLSSQGKQHQILAASDPSFLGNPKRYNPEELFVASLSACHMLWFLHLCASNNITVISYIDQAEGTMEEQKNGSGRFSKVTLKPRVIIKKADNMDLCSSLHHQANQMCFIANSCNFPIDHEPTTLIEKG